MRIFIVCIIAWFIAQLIKVIINSIKYLNAKRKGLERRKVTIHTLFKLGGMPSSHTATVIALCGCVGLHSGFDSDVFAACGVFAFIVMFDAFNRLQAKVCGVDATDVKKVEGHTIPEIIGGFIVGVCVALFMVKVVGIFEF